MTDHVNRNSITVSATATSATNAYGSNGNAVWVYNSGEVAVHVKSGASTVAATTSDNVIPAGQARTLIRDPNDTHLAIRTASSTATVYFHSTTKEG